MDLFGVLVNRLFGQQEVDSVAGLGSLTVITVPSFLKVDMRELINFAHLEEKVAKDLLESIKQVVATATIETHHKVVQKQPVFKGALRNATKFQVPIVTGRGRAKTVSGEIFMVGNAALYGNVQDLGRTPGAKMPPHAPLRRWVTLKLAGGKLRPSRNQTHQLDPRRRTKKAAIDQATFLIRRKISENPAKALHFFGQAEEFGQARLNQLANEAAKKFVDKLGR